LEVLNDWTGNKVPELQNVFKQEHIDPEYEELMSMLQEFIENKKSINRKNIQECV
jgi:hypothetical protein